MIADLGVESSPKLLETRKLMHERLKPACSKQNGERKA